MSSAAVLCQASVRHNFLKRSECSWLLLKTTQINMKTGLRLKTEKRYSSDRFCRQMKNLSLISLINFLPSLYICVLSYINALPEYLLYRFTHIDYKNEFALIGLIKENGKDAIVAIARYRYFPEENITDFGVAVRDDWQHLGIGTALLIKLFDIGRENGISRFDGTIHPENRIMVKTLSKLGYEMKYSVEGGFLKVEINV